jgi:hypothetical protein
MTPTAIDAMTRELRYAREFARGDIVRGTASVRCIDPSCPVGLIKTFYCEEPGTRPMQPPLRCPRCADDVAFVGVEIGG